MPLDYEKIGAQLRAAREARGLTQPDIARKLRMTASNVSRIEAGALTPIENLERYAHLVGCGLTVIFAAPDDRVGRVAARLASLVSLMDPASDASLLATLDAWADIWEAQQKAASRRPG